MSITAIGFTALFRTTHSLAQAQTERHIVEQIIFAKDLSGMVASKKGMKIEPIANATVTMFIPGEHKRTSVTTTGQDGSFSFSAPGVTAAFLTVKNGDKPGHTYQITIKSPSHPLVLFIQ